MLQDFRHALRSLARVPSFSLLVIITLALGIGANTAMFTVVDQVLLQKLPLPDPDSLLRIRESHNRPMNVTGATFRDLHERARSFSAFFAYRVFSRNLSDIRQVSPPQQIDTAYVSRDFFSVAATSPAMGAIFSTGDFR